MTERFMATENEGERFMAIGNEGKHTGNVADRSLIDAVVDAQLAHRQDGLHGEDHQVGAQIIFVATDHELYEGVRRELVVADVGHDVLPLGHVEHVPRCRELRKPGWFLAVVRKRGHGGVPRLNPPWPKLPRLDEAGLLLRRCAGIGVGVRVG